MCLAIATNLPPVFLTTFGETFGGEAGLSEEQLGRIPALVFAGFMLGIAFTGPLADRWGAKSFVLGGLGFMCAGLVVLGTAGSYAVLLVALLLLGVGAGMLEVVLSPIVAALQPHRRASVLNWLHSFYCIGAVGTVLLGSAALHLGISWRIVALGIIAVPAFLLLGFLAVTMPPMMHENAECHPLRSLLRHPFFLATLALICLGGAIEIGMAQWLPAYAERELGFTKATAGIALAAFSVAMVAGRISVGFVVKRTGAIPLMLFCCAASAALVLAGSLFPNAWMALIACIALGFTVCCFWPTTLGIAADRFPRGGVSMYALLAAFGNAGCMAMPWFVGVVAERGSLSAGLAMLVVCPLVMAVLLAGLRLCARPYQSGPLVQN